MTRHPTVAGIRFTTDIDVLLPDDGYFDADVGITWSPALDNGLNIEGPEGVEVALSFDRSAATVLGDADNVLHRSWQLKQAAPVIASCLQRLCLHASCVRVDGRVMAFVGASEAGKSTLAWHLVKSGHELISDDLLPIRFRDVPVVPGDRGGPVDRVFFLSRARGVLAITSLSGSDAIARHIENGFGEHGRPEAWAFQFDAYSKLVETVPHASLVIPDDRTRLDDVESALREEAGMVMG